MSCVLKNVSPLLAAILFVAVVPRSIEAGESAETIRRFAFIAGSNDGGPGRVLLRFAHTDAKAFARVMRQLGGVTARDSVVLLGPDRFDFEGGLARMRNLLESSRASGLRLELVFYFSGHSDEQGLLLGDDLITYRELREAISELPADVRIAILDSCSSGALTRGKGGTRRPPFLMDKSVDVKGYAYLTSSSADETAQESDRVGGSFFTHYLVSGLRGAADTSKDNKVTLNEAYQYAFNETLARTESTQAGPQHANYDFQLKGSGDLVLTDLRGTSALLILPASLEGRLFIRNRKGHLVAEINKPAGRPINMGLEPGTYEVTIEDGSGLKKGTIELSGGGKTELNQDRLGSIAKESTVERGVKSSGEPGPIPRANENKADEIVHRPFSVGLVPGLTTDGGSQGRTKNNFSLNFIGWGDYLTGFEFGFIGNIRKEDVRGGQAAGIFNFTKSSLMGGQWAGIANIVHGPIKGFQGAGIANVNTKGSAMGFQGAGISNFNNGGAIGFQGAAIVNVNKGFFKGFQGAGIANVSAMSASNGFQGAGITNYAGSLTGAQISSIANATPGEMGGLQAGLINYGGDVRGVQIGLINVSGKMAGAPIGLINAVGDGMLAPAIWTSDTSLVNVGLKMGSRVFYSILGYGVYPLGGEEERRDSLITGLGGHIDFNPVWIEIDLVSHWLHPDFDWSSAGDAMLHKFRVNVGWRIMDSLSVFVGPTANLLISDEARDVGFIPSTWSREVDDSLQLKMGPGFIAGIQFEPKWGNLNSRGD